MGIHHVKFEKDGVKFEAWRWTLKERGPNPIDQGVGAILGQSEGQAQAPVRIREKVVYVLPASEQRRRSRRGR